MMTIPTLDAIRALDGRNFAMLTADELAVLRFYRDQGHKFDVAITITSDADAKELERASREQADELMRRANSHVHIVVGANAEKAWRHRAIIAAADGTSLAAQLDAEFAAEVIRGPLNPLVIDKP